MINNIIKIGNIIKIKNNNSVEFIIQNKEKSAFKIINLPKNINNLDFIITFNKYDCEIYLHSDKNIFEKNNIILNNGYNLININNNFINSTSFEIYFIILPKKKNFKIKIKNININSYNNTFFDIKKFYDIKNNIKLNEIKNFKFLIQNKIKYFYISKMIKKYLDIDLIKNYFKKYNIYEILDNITNNDYILHIGIFNNEDFNFLQNSKNIYILWCKTDTDYRIKKNNLIINNIKKYDNIIHFCNYSFSQNNLKVKDISSELISDNDFDLNILKFKKNTQLGKKILIYFGIENYNENNEIFDHFKIIFNNLIEKENLNFEYEFLTNELLYECKNDCCLVVVLTNILTDTDKTILKEFYDSTIPVISLINFHSNMIICKNFSIISKHFHSYIKGIDYYNKNNLQHNNKVSIIITTYNREDTILRSIYSLLNQTHKNIKIIIVDDNSTDNTVSILQKNFKNYDNILIVKNFKNKGTYYCKNIGLYLMDKDTEFYSFQDSDDISHSNRIEIQLQTMIKYNLKCSMCEMVRNNILRPSYITQFYNIEVFNNIGFFDNSTRFGADSEYLYRFMKFYNISPKNLHRGKIFGSNNKSNTSNYEEKYYKFIPIILYFVIDDSKTTNLTITHPIGGNERDIYANNFKNKINNISDKSELKYYFCFNKIHENKIFYINNTNDIKLINDENLYIIKNNKYKKDILNILNNYKYCKYIFE